MDSKERCKICNNEFDQDKFGRHLRKHSIKVADYYLTYYPRVDLFTGAPLVFKDRDSFFLHDFLYRQTLISYLEKRPCEETKQYAIELLARHKAVRELNYAPSQVELRSSILPARNYYEKNFGSYIDICTSLGFTNRFEHEPEICSPAIPDDFQIWFDTREQQPLDFKCKSRRLKLDFGDYTCGGKFYDGVFIERKSIPDLVNTLSQHHERFIAEVERARDVGAYLVVLVECSISDAMHFSIPQAKATPVFIFSRIKKLMQSFTNIQFVFADGREKAAQLVVELLLLGRAVKKIDLQYALEKRQLCG